MKTEIMGVGDSAERIEQAPTEHKVGDWVLCQNEDKDGELYGECTNLGVVTKTGTNFVGIKFLQNGSTYTDRIHANHVHAKIKPIPEEQAREMIMLNIDIHRTENQRLLGQLSDLVSRMGLSGSKCLEAATVDSTALVLHKQSDVGEYEKFLVKAKEKDIPELQSAISAESAAMASWMKTVTYPMTAMQDQLKKQCKGIDDKIFNVRLYSGLLEDMVTCKKGEPADITERLRLMQRRLYMDEESLLDYDKGGMEFADITEFDAWLCRPKNLKRILPFERCIVSMKIRRKHKHREVGHTLADIIMNHELRQLDTITVLYIRNGENVYRLHTDLDFGEMLFPDTQGIRTLEPMMAKTRWGRHGTAIPVREYEARCAEQEEKQALYEQWDEENEAKLEDKESHIRNPHWFSTVINPDDWAPLDDNNVYLDDMMANMEEEAQQYNRIALILQGLFDRSIALHPHHPVKMWTSGGIEKAVELIYDSSHCLNFGDPPPSFEEYRTAGQATIRTGTAVMGQETPWLRKMADVENNRSSWRYHRDHVEYYRPYGNPGPGTIAKVGKYRPRKKQATFYWERERQRDTGWSGDPSKLPCTFTTDITNLFNIDAYTPGDVAVFFKDPRTREQYLQWAPLMLTAEKYHARDPEAEFDCYD